MTDHPNRSAATEVLDFLNSIEGAGNGDEIEVALSECRDFLADLVGGARFDVKADHHAKELIEQADAALTSTAPQTVGEPSPCAYTGYVPHEGDEQVLVRIWGFGRPHPSVKDVRLLYSFPPNEPQPVPVLTREIVTEWLSKNTLYFSARWPLTAPSVTRPK